MDLVALTELATTDETEAPLLAANLGVSVYEARQKLAVGMPAVVLMTRSRPQALDLLAQLRARKHAAVACDSSAVVPAAAMVQVRKFLLAPRELVIEAPVATDAPITVPYAEIVALVRAIHRSTVETRDAVKERKLRPFAAIATGGDMLTKTVKHEVRTVSEEREQVLYLFRRRGVPCLLRESTGQYAGLGERVRPTRLENFATTLRLLREQAPLAPFDTRLASVRKLPELPADDGAPRAFDPVNGGVDVLAHLIAMSLPEGAGGPFRR